MEDTGPGNGKNAGWYETWAFGSVADTWTAPGSLARLADTWTGAWGSGSVYLEKVPAFFDFAGTFFDAKPIEAHRGSLHCVIWLDAGTFDSKISYRPANKLTDTARNCLFPCFQHWFRPQQAYFTKYSLINPST